MASAHIHAFEVFFLTVLRTIFFQNDWLLSNIAIIKTGSKRGMNPVAMTMINPLTDDKIFDQTKLKAFADD